MVENADNFLGEQNSFNKQTIRDGEELLFSGI